MKHYATRLLKLLKDYELGYVKKTELHFTTEEIERALKLKCNTTRMLVWKAAIAVSYCGERRLSDMIFIKLQACTLLAQLPHFQKFRSKF